MRVVQSKLNEFYDYGKAKHFQWPKYLQTGNFSHRIIAKEQCIFRHTMVQRAHNERRLEKASIINFIQLLKFYSLLVTLKSKGKRNFYSPVQWRVTAVAGDKASSFPSEKPIGTFSRNCCRQNHKTSPSCHDSVLHIKDFFILLVAQSMHHFRLHRHL